MAQVFVELAGSAVTDPADPSGLFARLAAHSTRLLGLCAATVLYVPDERDAPQLTVSEGELSRLERQAVEWAEGPAHECHRSGERVPDTALDGDRARQRWPRYTARALDLGYRRTAALPLLGPTEDTAVDTDGDTDVFGALVLFTSGTTPLTDDVLTLGRSLADIAGVVLARDREVRESRALADQLGQALTSRIVIEQAKGVLAARLSLPVDAAFTVLRAHARSHRRRLPEVAREVVEDGLRIEPE